MRSYITEAYLKRVDKEKMPADNYTSPKLEEFKIGIENPSKHLTVLCYQNAYINDKLSYECERMFT